MGGGGPLERYQKLGLRDSLSRIYQYPLACKELSFILRSSYSKFPKNLQSLILEDALTAFRLLPEMQTKTAISAANILIQGAEAALPKQKKALAVTEFRRAMVALKRRSKPRQDEEGSAYFPHDVLVHIFSFLDMRSLVSAALVCRSWNVASSENDLWQSQYVIFYNTASILTKIKLLDPKSIEEKYRNSEGDNSTGASLDWRFIFKKAYRGSLWKKFSTCSRGFCKHCEALVWLNDISNDNSRLNCKYHRIEPLSTQQISEYLEGRLTWSDSDSDNDSTSKLWAYPKCSSS